jgi:hypothetical protein
LLSGRGGTKDPGRMHSRFKDESMAMIGGANLRR